MDSSSIYKKVEQYVIDLFENNVNGTLAFHNIKHTKTVVSRTKEIGGHYDLTERDTLVLFMAAWFHDTGHLFTNPVGHEVKSVEIMRNFIKDHSHDEQLAQEVDECIMATRAPRNPVTLREEILCDADTYHFGTKEFKETNKLVLKEMELKNGKIDRNEVYKEALKMLEDHQFYTSYCKEPLNDNKKKNIRKLKKKLSEMNPS